MRSPLSFIIGSKTVTDLSSGSIKNFWFGPCGDFKGVDGQIWGASSFRG